MSASTLVHHTFVIEKSCEAPPARVFGAYADVRARQQWGSPGGDEIVYSASDFRVGGSDTFRCGPKTDLKYEGTVRYEDLVDNVRIVFTERVRVEHKTLSVGVTTWELLPEGSGTRLVATTQMISFVGAEMVKASESGSRAAIENLVKWLSSL